MLGNGGLSYSQAGSQSIDAQCCIRTLQTEKSDQLETGGVGQGPEKRRLFFHVNALSLVWFHFHKSINVCL